MRLYIRKPSGEPQSGSLAVQQKNGRITAHGFTCGYVEIYESKETVPYTVHITDPPIETTQAAIEVKIQKISEAYFITLWDGEYIIRRPYGTIKQARAKVADIRREYKGR